MLFTSSSSTRVGDNTEARSFLSFVSVLSNVHRSMAVSDFEINEAIVLEKLL